MEPFLVESVIIASKYLVLWVVKPSVIHYSTFDPGPMTKEELKLLGPQNGMLPPWELAFERLRSAMSFMSLPNKLPTMFEWQNTLVLQWSCRQTWRPSSSGVLLLFLTASYYRRLGGVVRYALIVFLSGTHNLAAELCASELVYLQLRSALLHEQLVDGIVKTKVCCFGVSAQGQCPLEFSVRSDLVCPLRCITRAAYFPTISKRCI